MSISSPAAPPAPSVSLTEATPGTRGLLRAAVFFPLLFGLATVAWRPLSAGLGWLLIPLGQRALLAYSLHLFLALAAYVWWPIIPWYDMESAPVNTLAQVAAVGVLWTLVSPTAAFVWLATWMLVAVVAFLSMPGDDSDASRSATR